jgi:hypothetical protein
MGPSDAPTLAHDTLHTEAPSFDIHVRGVTQRVRSALADALASVGADATKPQSISKQLKLDKSLAWKAAKIVTDSDPFSAIPRLPGRSGVKILMDALEAAQAPESLVTEFRVAMAEFDRMVATHAGSRETLQMMLANVSNEGQRDRDEQHRKLAFQGNSAIWGVQARVHVGLHFLAPAANQPDLLDTATISGLVDFKRLRQHVPWSVAQMHMFDDGGKYVPIQGFAPLDPALGVDDPPILREFCSASLPPLRIQRTRSGPTRFQITEGPVGITGSATCMTGWLHRATASIYATDDDKYGDLVVFMNTPSELVIHDLFVHKSMPFAHHPQTLVYSQLPGEAVYPHDGREHGILPIEGERIDLGYGLTNLTTPEVPRFRSMVEMATTQLGHHFTDFVGIRFKLRYPPIPAVGVFRFELLKR